MKLPVIGKPAVSDIGAISGIADESGLSFWPVPDLVNELDRDDSIFLSLKPEGGIVVGFILARLVPSTRKDASLDCEIYNMGVTVGCRRRGYGESLLNALLQICRRARVKTVWVDVRESNNAAIAFYDVLGFVHQTIRRDFYRNPVENAVIMSLDIDPEA
jgi:ribosomal protein S18 acetylase RimI-like enzyme